ncbi:MAG: hypothetical protein LBR89_01020 [Holosporales bacterium]|nr:hypothetical protein [Holosporales bacterium]
MPQNSPINNAVNRAPILRTDKYLKTLRIGYEEFNGYKNVYSIDYIT